jgi:8-oxo-dGDP phosphatase
VVLEDTPESWPVVRSVDVHRDDWVIAMRRDTVTRPDGGPEFDRLVMEHPGAAVVLALDAEDRVLCLRQYRHAAGHRFVELPAGLIDHPGEDPLEVAQRELQEEGEYAARRWRHLVSTYASPGISQEIHHYYLAQDLEPSSRGSFVLEHEEADMQTFWVPMTELVDAVLDGRVTDGPLAIAVLSYDAIRRREAAATTDRRDS